MDWTDFLTGQDNEVLAATSWAKSAPFGLGTRPVLLIVDLYYAALGHPRADILDAVADWPSGFHETPLDTVLRGRDADTLLVCGEATSGCVRATVVDACTRGYRVGVVGDCCFDRFEASHWMSLFDMNQKYTDVFSADHAIEYLRDLPEGREAA